MPRALIPTGLCVLSACLLVLSFPSADKSILAWGALVPLLLGAARSSARGAFSMGYLTGFLFFLGNIYWLNHVSSAGWIFLAAYLAFYPACFALGVRMTARRSAFIGVLGIPSLWVTLELLRAVAFTGFPWSLMGYTQYRNIPLIQIAGLTGVYGVSWLVVSANAALYLFIQKRVFWPAVFSGILILASCGYGTHTLSRKMVPGPRVAVVQGNIPQEDKWDPILKEMILEKYDALTREVQSRYSPELIIWPETAFPGYYPSDTEAHRIRKLVQVIETPLLMGAPFAQSRRVTNSAILLSGRGEEAGRYDKIHLVPFGEYLPLGSLLTFLRTVDSRIGAFSRGQEYTVFRKEVSAPFSVLICFEDLFPALVRRFVREGAQFLVNITNDAWFGDTAAPHQHLQASVFRAVENGVGVVRAANTGVSAVIDSRGRVTNVVEDPISSKRTFVTGSLYAQAALLNRHTLYTGIGDIFAWICLAVCFAVFLPPLFLRARSGPR